MKEKISGMGVCAKQQQTLEAVSYSIVDALPVGLRRMVDASLEACLRAHAAMPVERKTSPNHWSHTHRHQVGAQGTGGGKALHDCWPIYLSPKLPSALSHSSMAGEPGLSHQPDCSCWGCLPCVMAVEFFMSIPPV